MPFYEYYPALANVTSARRKEGGTLVAVRRIYKATSKDDRIEGASQV
ncbi:MAG TPA: hypothetical protein VGF86_05130 [Candidatus Tumulicola sp.]